MKQTIKSDKIGQLGDFIGGVVGSIWALVGVILFYLALKEQRKDIQINQKTLLTQVEALNHQIEEFRLQTDELALTREVFKEQGETLKIQRFENTFFQLLNLHHELIDKLKFEMSVSMMGEKDIFKERDVFLQSVKILKEIFPQNKIRFKNDFKEYEYRQIEDIEEAYKLLKSKYSDFYFKINKQLLSSYYRNIYHIFKFIRNTKLIEPKSKQFYASIVRAQLSSDELYLIMYNSLVEGLGKPEFLSLIKEFDVMQNFDFGLISKYKFHKEIFDNEINKL